MKQDKYVADNPKDNLRMMKIMVAALIIGIVLFSVMAYVINQLNGRILDELDTFIDTILISAAVILAVVCLSLAIVIYTKQVKALKNLSLPLNERLNNYRAILIKFMALCEGPALFTIIVVFLTGDFRVFVVTTILTATMFLKMPTKQRIIDVLQLNWSDQQEL